jgi:hypothetical protein
MPPQSFFDLTSRPPTPPLALPLHGLTPDQFDVACTEAEPIADALMATLATFGATHQAVSLLVVYLAADLVRDTVLQDWRETMADA